MKYRAAISVSAFAVAVVAGHASAATKPKPKPKPKAAPVCNLITDPSADAHVDLTGGFNKSGAQDPNSEITSADIASNATSITAVIRVASLASPDTNWPEAHNYTFEWTVPGHSTPVYLGATIDPNPASAAYGPQFVFGDVGTVAAPVLGPVITYFNIYNPTVKGTVDAAKGTITLSVPISQLSAYGTFTPGTVFTGLTAVSSAEVNGPNTPTNIPVFGGNIAQGVATVDTDTTKTTYLAGSPSCVTPGS